jgi:parallel beta-helix repeat protein
MVKPITVTDDMRARGQPWHEILRAMRETVANVKAFGAQGDGTTDDTLAIQRASRYLAGGNGTLYFPPGTYKMSWQGEDFAIYEGDDSATSQTSYCYWLRANNIRVVGENATIKATLDLSTEGSLNVISFYGCHNLLVEGLTIDYEVDGAAAAGEGHRAVALRFQHEGTGIGCENVWVQNNRIRVAYVGPETGAKNDGGGADNSYAKLTGVSFYGNARPTEPEGVFCSGLNVLHNDFYRCTARVLWTWNCEKLLVDGNRFENSHSTRPSVRVTQPHNDIRIVNNFFTEDADVDTHNYYAIGLNSDDKDLPNSCRRAIIANNQALLSLSGLVYVTGWREVECRGNQFVRRASISGTPVSQVISMRFDATEDPNTADFQITDCAVYGGGSIHSDVPRTRIRNCLVFDHVQYAPMLGAINLAANADGSSVIGCQVHTAEKYGISVVDANEVTIADCQVQGAAELGIYISQSNKAIVRGCRISDNSGSGIYVINSEDPQIQGNRIYDNTGDGVKLFGTVPNALVLDNRVEGNSSDDFDLVATAVCQRNWPDAGNNGVVTHDYAAGAAAWSMSAVEAAGQLFVLTNAGGAADAVFPAAAPGKLFAVQNSSGQAITFKVSGQSGFAVANGKYAIGVMGATDCVEIYEQP